MCRQKKKYRLSHRKSSDGNDRDVLVLKSIGWGEETLKLDAWVEELTPAQLEMRTKCKKEIDDLNSRLEKLIKDTSSEIIFEGENTALYELEKEVAEKRAQTVTNPQTNSHVTPSKNNNQSGFQLVMDPRSGVVVGTMTPASSVQPTPPPPKPQTRKRTRASSNLSPVPQPPTKVAKPSTPASKPTPPPPPPPPVQNSPQVQTKPTEATSVGGLSHGSSQKNVAAVVDLTSEDGRSTADSREISFNKLQGKTFPSLVVVARPHLRIKDATGTERTRLDAKVKAVLMHAPTKFTEWLIQQGLIRSEQTCSTHSQSKLKLGMYSDVSKFPFSGGYVWISECCPQRFVSVFSGSLFEGSPHPPSVILKLIYHWACQTNVQNVVQWVKVDNLYVKGLNTWLRATCTVALHTHVGPLGGPGKKVEVGVISLGTTSQDGHQRQVKVEVLGLLETDAKLIRLRAVEPLADGDRNYKKRFSKILEPLLHWVHPESIIVTDLTVDKTTLHQMGFKHVTQSTSNENSISNHTIMEYLRRIVPRMFQNTLSLLSRQIIQQFLDELVWREWFGNSTALAFDNIIIHLADQTRVDTGQSLIMRLNKVAANPFKNWSIKQHLVPQTSKSITEPAQQKRNAKSRKVTPKPPSPAPEISRPPKPISPDIPEQMVPLEHYYYGTIDGIRKSEDKVVLNLKCGTCKAHFTNNIKLMTHLFTHAHNVYSGAHQCCYCLATVTTKEVLDKHIATSHPTDTRCGDNFVCIICEGRFYNTYSLGKHMSKEHLPSELPYQCGTCSFRCSSHKQAVDHFYASHDGAGTMQCPFCLKSTCIASNGRMVPQNLNYFLQHLQKHQKKSFPKKCSKCALWFVQKDVIREHQQKMHVTQRRKAGLVPWPVPRQSIMVPKSRQEEPVEEEEVDISNIVFSITDKLKCRECSYNLNTRDHFPALLNCTNNNCQYSTCCKNSMNKHIAECKIFHSTLPVQRLPFQMYCVCGYNNLDGNLMAKHLAVCERKSAYPSEEAAKAATVTHSMLDVLGLIRRPEEPSLTTNEVTKNDEEDVKTNSNQKAKKTKFKGKAKPRTMSVDKVPEKPDKKKVMNEESTNPVTPDTTSDITTEVDITLPEPLDVEDKSNDEVTSSSAQLENDPNQTLNESDSKKITKTKKKRFSIMNVQKQKINDTSKTVVILDDDDDVGDTVPKDDISEIRDVPKNNPSESTATTTTTTAVVNKSNDDETMEVNEIEAEDTCNDIFVSHVESSPQEETTTVNENNVDATEDAIKEDNLKENECEPMEVDNSESVKVLGDDDKENDVNDIGTLVQ